jgi:glycosyltransferase involved in cell wall biosynthesis
MAGSSVQRGSRSRRDDEVRNGPFGILYVANASKVGGGNRILMDLATGMDRRRFYPFVVAPEPGPLVDWASASGIGCSIVRSGDAESRFGMYRRGIALAAVARAQRCQLIHAMAETCYRGVGVAGALLRAPRVCHLGFPPTFEGLRWHLAWVPELVIGCFRGQAREAEEMMVRMGRACRVVAVTNGIDIDRFAPKAAPPEGAARWRFGASHVVVIVGHLSDVKGYPVLLRAAARIIRDLPDCAFVSVGSETIEQGAKDRLSRMADDLGIASRVHFLGWRQEVQEILASADVVTLPSLAEGLPLAILEAMAASKPIVATPVGGVPDAVEDGTNGLLVPPGDDAALAGAIGRLLVDRDLAMTMGRNARARVEKEFSVSRMVNEVQGWYDAVIGGGDRPVAGSGDDIGLR